MVPCGYKLVYNLIQHKYPYKSISYLHLRGSYKSALNPIKIVCFSVQSPLSRGFPMVFLVFPWFSYSSYSFPSFPAVFPWLSHLPRCAVRQQLVYPSAGRGQELGRPAQLRNSVAAPGVDTWRTYGGFHKWVYLQIIHFLMGFSHRNHLAIGVPPFMETLICN